MQSNESERVLIVDDHPINAEILEELLCEHYDLAVASSGEEALDLAGSFAPDLVLLDIMMPGIDGYETCRRLRSNARFDDVKIIMVSARAMEYDKRLGFDAGADDYVTKPIDNRSLLELVRAHLGSERRGPGDSRRAAAC